MNKENIIFTALFLWQITKCFDDLEMRKLRNERFFFAKSFFLVKLIFKGWVPLEFILPPTLRKNLVFLEEKQENEWPPFNTKKKAKERSHTHTQTTYRKKTLKAHNLKHKKSRKRIRKPHFTNVSFLGILNYGDFAIFEVLLF